MKQNDWLVASLNNPDFTPQDFKDISGMSLDNTQFLSKETYKQKPYIRNQQMFKDKEGNFSDTKFDQYYNSISNTFRDFSTEDTVDNYEYDIWDINRPAKGKIKNINFNLNTVNNPDHIRIGVGGINVVTNSDKSKRELAQNSKIFDPATGTYLDKSVNDISFFNNPFDYISSLFDDPLVYATYDEDTVEVDPITGNKVTHKKGEWKVNEDGEYYTEKANGRNLRGKTVVSASDYITDENSKLNSVDFMDSDDLQKSVAGTVAKNVAAIVPMFIPYVNTAYSGLLVTRELAKTLPMAYGMVSSLTGDENPNSKLMNTIASYGQKFTTSTSDYAQENTFSFENFGNLMSDVALQWGQQKFIANTFNKLKGGGEEALNIASAKAQKAYIDKANKYIQESLEGKISKSQLSSYLGTNDPFNISKMLESGKWAETALGKAALNKYMPAAEKILSNRNRLAQDLSLGYMALISNTDVYESVLEKGGTPAEAAAIAFGSTLGMYSVDKYLGLGEMFFQKDPAKLALRQTAKENAALYMAGKKTVEDLSTKKGIINTIQKGIQLGKKTVDKFSEKYKNGTLGLIGKAIGEGTEEVSEELVTDLSKNLGELAGKLGYFSQTDYGAWENMGERYAMSFLGGAAGGAMFGGVEAWNNRNNTTKDFQHDMTDLIRQGKKEDILKELKSLRDNGTLGSSNLSYDSTTDSDGNQTYLTADENHKSQAQSNYEGLTNIVNQLDLILNGNQINLSDDQLFDKMVQGEYRANALSDFLEGSKGEDVKNASYISKYQSDFKKLSDEIIKNETKISELVNNTTDESKKHNPEYENKLQNLQQRKEDLLKQRDYLFGEGSLGYVEKTLFAMDTNLSGRFISLNLNQYARELTGKSLKDLTPGELKTVQDKYNDWTKNGKTDLDIAFKLYKNMEKQLLPELKTLQSTNFDKELSNIEKLRKNDPSKKLLSVNDKLDTETDEEFLSLMAPLEGETEEDFKARQKKHADAVNKYNLDNQFKWIQEFAKQPITSTDFRYFVSQIGALRGELLKYYLDNVGTKTTNNIEKHWWEMQINPSDGQEIDPDDKADIEKQNTDLHDLILSMGIQNPSLLKKEIYNRIKETANSIADRRYANVGEYSQDVNLINTFKQASQLSADEKEQYGIPLDYNYEDNGTVTYKDLFSAINLFTKRDGNSLEDTWDYFQDLSDDISPVQKFYSLAAINPEILNSDEANQVIDISSQRYSDEIDKIADQISGEYLKNLDVFIDGVNDSPQTKTLNALEGTTFVNNPVIPLLNKISKFSSNSNVNVEDLLQDVYNNYNSQDTNSDFQLSDTQLSSLKQVLNDFNTAEAFIYGASVRTSGDKPIGHNKSINQFVKNHQDIFKNVEELPEIKQNDATMLLGEIATYKREINSWITKHNQNAGQREVKFIKANKALNSTIKQFFDLNRNSFKISPDVDLLDGYEDLTLDDSLSSVVALQYLLYKNKQKYKLTTSEILDSLSKTIFNPKEAISQKSARLDENLTYKELTSYDKFQFIVSSIAASNIKYYKQLKSFLDQNKDMAPIAIQEQVSKIAYSQIENPAVINEALEWLKKKTGSKMDIAYNTTVVTGLGGSGKTFAVAKLNLGTGENTWISGPGQSQIDNLNKSLPDSTGKSKQDLFKLIFGGKIPSIETLYNKQKENDSTIQTLKENIKLAKIENPPKNLVIDEATHFSTPELLIISKFCNENGINLILIGDEHQNGYYKDNVGNIEDNSLIAWRTSPLYLSLRNGNALKVSNQQPLLSIIDSLAIVDPGILGDTVYKQQFKQLQLKYYNKDVFSGELIANEVPSDIINKIPKDASVGFIGDSSSPEYKKLVDAGLKVSDPMNPTDIQGREFDYVIVDKKWNLDLGDNWNHNNIDIYQFAKDLYTLITRSTKGTILLDNGLSKLVKNVESEYNGEYSGLEQSVQKFRETRIPEIEKALEDNKEEEIQQDDSGTNDESKDNKGTDQQNDQQDNQEDTQEIKDEKPINVAGQIITDEQLHEEQEPVTDNGDNTYEESESNQDELNQSTILDNPITVYSSVSYSGINTANDTWVNDTNSVSDLGIFVKPGEQVTKGKVGLMKKVIQLKNIIIYGIDYYDRLPPETKEIFSKDSFENAQYFIKIEDVNDSNRLIGLTKGTGLTNENRAVRGKIIKLVAKLNGKDGKVYEVSLGGLNSPDTWKNNAKNIKEAIKTKIDNGTIKNKTVRLYANIKDKHGNIHSLELKGLNNYKIWENNSELIDKFIKNKQIKPQGNLTITTRVDGKSIELSSMSIENSLQSKTWRDITTPMINKLNNEIGVYNQDFDELQKLYDSYDDTITKYSTLVDSWVQKNQEFRINPPKFSQYTRLMPLDSSYRLEDSVNSTSPYGSMAPLQIESDINIVIDDIPGISSEMRGKPVMFVSSNLLLSPSELKNIYIKQTQDSTMPKQVRMIRLDNVGVSFKSLYQKKWIELYNNKVGNCTFTTPMELQPFAIRMYKAMWNYRAGLNRFIERYDQFCKENELNDNDINKLCQMDNAEYQRLSQSNPNLSEDQYRKLVSPEQKEKLKVLWDFNDSLARYVKEFRLGYNSTHGAYLRKLTNIDSKLYNNPDNVVGIYINPEIAKMQLGVIENIFTNIVDKIIPPSEQNKKTYISTNLGKLKNWFQNIQETNSITLDFQDENADTKSTLHISDKSNLTTLPLVMIKVAHYINIQMTMGKDNFLDFLNEAKENDQSPYSIKYQDQELNWANIIDPIDNQVEADKEQENNYNIPGIIPYDKKSGTGVYDSRMDDLFNLMFHGVISTPVENDFTRDNIRATAAQFKYGIFSDPILVERKNEDSGQIDRSVTNKKLFSSNAVASSPLIAININPYIEEQKKDNKSKSKLEDEIISPMQKLHNSIKDALNLSGIDIDYNDFDNINDYVEVLNGEIDVKLRDFISNNSEIPFDNIITNVSENGDISLLKNSEEFKNKTLINIENIPNAKRLTFTDNEGNEYYYNIHYDKGLVIVPDKKEKFHPDVISSEEATNRILNATNNFFNSLDSEDLEEFKKELKNILQPGDISWNTFEMVVNKMRDYLQNSYGDKETNEVTKDLNDLTDSCSI